tara:strand:- start:4116 stop:5297 length:1182 start_codon:yes stop_codon:yes gene_type:complete
MESLDKVLFFHQTSIVGGATKSGSFIIKALNNIDVYCSLAYRSSEKGKLKEFFSSDAVQIDKYIDLGTNIQPFYHYNGNHHNIFSLHFIKSILFIVKSVPKIYKLIKKESPDLIIINSVTLFWISLLVSNRKAKKVCWVRETLPKEGKGFRSKFIQYIVSKHCHKIVFISNYDLIKFKSPHNKKKLIYNPNKFDEFSLTNYDLQNKKNKFLFLGGINELKGTIFLLQAFSIALSYKQDLKLTIGGVFSQSKKQKLSKYQSKCLRLIQDINKEHANSIVLKESNHDVSQSYKETDYSIFCPSQIHQSRTIFESANYFKPVLIPSLPNLKEFSNIKGVFTFKNKDQKSLANLILDLSNLKYNISKNELISFKNEMVDMHSNSNFQKSFLKLLDEI